MLAIIRSGGGNRIAPPGRDGKGVPQIVWSEQGAEELV